MTPPATRVQFPAEALVFCTPPTGHAAQRPPGLGITKTGGLEGIEPPSLGPKPGIVPVDHNPTGGCTSPAKKGIEPELTQ